MHTHQVPEGVHLHAEVMHSLGVVFVVQLNHLPVVLPHRSLLPFFVLESIQRVVILLYAKSSVPRWTCCYRYWEPREAAHPWKPQSSPQSTAWFAITAPKLWSCPEESGFHYVNPLYTWHGQDHCLCVAPGSFYGTNHAVCFPVSCLPFMPFSIQTGIGHWNC